MNLSVTSKNFNVAATGTKPLNFKLLNKQPRLTVDSAYDWYFFIQMAANKQHLLYCPAGYLRLVDEQGNKIQSVPNQDNIMDIHWSSYLNEFLILTDWETIKGFNCTTGVIRTIWRVNEKISSFSSYEETLLMCINMIGSVIFEYNLSDWKLKRTIKPPISCKKHESILEMRFSSSGQHLAFVLNERDYPNFLYWIELRQSNTLNVLHVLRLGNENISHNILQLPNEKTLVNTLDDDKRFFVINNLNGEIEETISYDSNQQIKTTALIGGRCLVVQVKSPGPGDSKLRFHDL